MLINILNSIIIFLIAFFLIFLWFSYTRFLGAEFVKMPEKERRAMLKMLNLNKKDIFYDLGCGDASLIIAAAHKVKKAIGIEIDPIRFLIALFRIRIRTKTSKIKNAKILYGNLFKIPFNEKKEAIAIAVFLSKEANIKLGNKIKKELAREKKGNSKKGKKEKIKIASYKWPIPSLKLVKYNKKHRIFLYKA